MLRFDDLDPKQDHYASQVVDRVLLAAVRAGASDIHLLEVSDRIHLRWRIHGKLLDLDSLPIGRTTSVMGRVKALAHLVGYRRDIPQEGRLLITDATSGRQVEARVGTLPVLGGERAVIRLGVASPEYRLPQQLGLPAAIQERLETCLQAASGVILICGPAGSGKTTTAYASLRQLLSQDVPRSVVTLEDPVESELEGIAQSQVNPAGDFHWAAGLKAVLRQDSEIMLIGEIRDPATASVVFQAAMTGQLVITTMHARSCVDCLRRLLDMGVPYQHLRGGLSFLCCQRLLPRLCACRAEQPELPNQSCEKCSGTGTAGRQLLAEMLPALEGDLARAIVQDADSATLQSLAQALGMYALAEAAAEAVQQGIVSQADVTRTI